MPREYLPVSALRPGMTGYGLTVFRGNQIGRFDVTVLGVLKKIYNGRDLVLVKLGGPNMRRLSGIAHGMSGSPVYVNGRLVGAVSMGSQFTREPMGYVTPIESMLDAWDPAIPQYKDLSAANTSVAPPPIALSEPVTVEGRRFDQIAFLPPGGPGAASSSFGPNTLIARPAATRVMVAGVSGPRFRMVADALSKLGLDAQQGPGRGIGAGLKGAPLVPGGAIGMSLATGDIDLTATGTVTYRRGGRLLAFGHPFMGIGPLAAPMFTAYVHDMEPSYAESSMIASPVDLVGSFSQDRPFSVAGTIGAPPTMVPITVRVHDRMMGRDRVFRARLIRHPQLTPLLATVAANAAVAEVHGQPGDAMATVRTEVVADEVGTISRTNRVYDSQQIDAAALGDLQSVMNLLSSNPFYPVPVRSVRMEVTIDRGRRTAQVERIFLKQTRYEPGDTVDVGVVLKPYKQDRVVRTMQVRIPPSTAPGTLMLSVQGGGSSGGGIRIGGITIMPSGGGGESANAATVKQLAQKWVEKERNDELVAKLALPTAAVSVQGEKLSNLPPNIEAAMRGGGGARSSGVRLERDEVKETQETPYVLSGAQSLPIRVARRGQPDRPAGLGGPDSPAAPGGDGPGGPGSGSSSPSASSSPSTSPAAAPTLSPVPVGDEPDEDSLTAFPRAGGGVVHSVVPDDSDENMTVIRVQTNRTPSTGAAASTVARPATERTGTGTSVSASAGASVPAITLVGRAAGVWRHATAADFRTGKLEGVTVTSFGDVRLAPRLTKVAESAEPYFWSLAPGEDGSVYAGSGDNGVIYRADASGKLTAWARTGELEVHALARGKDGTLYAGTSPHGRVFRVGPDGKPVLLREFKEKYILGLALSPDETTLYAATGGGAGKVYAVPLSGGEPTVAYEGGEDNVSALAVGPDGGVYAGTAPNGLVVKVAGPGVSKSAVLYDAAEPSVSGLAVSKDGVVFAATAPRGVLYRIAPGAAPRVVYDKAPGGTLANLQMAQDGTLYTASGATVIALNPTGDSVRTFDAASDIQILSVLLAPNGGLWASTGNTAGVYRLDSGNGTGSAGEGSLTSPVLDARASARWGALRWAAGVPAGANVYLQTRSGDTAEPDPTWSDWSRPYAATIGETITSPPGRYLQYRAVLKGTAAGVAEDGPVLRTVELFYLTPNQAPQVALVAPRGGEVWRGGKVVRWTGADPDRDTLQYEVTVSGDGGKTWKPLRTAAGARTFTAPATAPATSARATLPVAPQTAAPAAPVSATATANPDRALAELRSELERHPEISPEMRDRILADAPGQVSAAPLPVTAAPSVAVPVGGVSAPATRETSLPFDTTDLSDGTYLLRIAASDRPSNPQGALTNEKVSGEFRVVNRPPTLVLFRKAVTVLADRSARVEGIALHRGGVAVRGAQYRVDGGDWMAAVAQDGIFDSDSEPFALTTASLPSGSHTVEVQTQDEAGNVASQQVTVTVR
jgi:sugar lactone lactonase YvrE